jgi:toxin FitB
MYLLDTNVISELRKPRPHGAVVAWISSVDDAHLYLSAVTIAEIQAGVEVTRDQDEAKAQEIEAWLDLVSTTYNVLPMDAATFRAWAKLMHRRSNTFYEDAMIAATAQAHNLTVVTRNVGDFKPFGVSVLNPFKEAHGRPKFP